MSCGVDNHDHDSHANNGMMTKIWGKAGWTFNHTVTYGYPLNPSPKRREKTKAYFMNLGNVLPCKYCRKSYNFYINNGDTKLTDADLENRETLTRWFFRVHNAVNEKLGVDYGMTYEKLTDKYESFRARCDKNKTGCVAPLDYKAFSFKKLYSDEAPIIPLALARTFVPLANKYELSKHFHFFHLAEALGDDYTKIMEQECWDDRNDYCTALIKYMRLNAISSLDHNGLPTISEMMLILYGCSNLSITELKEASIKVSKSLY